MKERLLLADRLRDIHQPPASFWWPPAPGWWLLAGLVLLLAVAGFLLHRRRTALRREALLELSRLRQRYQAEEDPRGLAMGLEMLLRRVAMARLSRQAVASLQGEAWLALLDRLGATREFSQGPGRQLLEAPWRSAPSLQVKPLLQVVERWLRRVA